MRILITEVNTKNSIALQKELYQHPNLFLIGFDDNSLLIAKQYSYCKNYFNGCLIDVVNKVKPDLIIPVGGSSVKICSENFRHITLLPSLDSLRLAFNKFDLIQLEKISGINYPVTNKLNSIGELMSYSNEFPLVVKSNNESLSKFDPIYIESNFSNLSNEYKIVEGLLLAGTELLVQKKVYGVGRGFFCIAKNGQIFTYYMHERIREYPISGGSSTAAKSIYCPIMHEISEKIVNHLNWSGPLMIEYKFNKDNYEYYLIELNPKFWGSLDLSYEVGLSFGKTLVDLYNNVLKVPVNSNYIVGISFYWILDGDLLNIVKSKKFLKIVDYFKPNARNSIFINLRSDLIKLLWTLKKIFE